MPCQLPRLGSTLLQNMITCYSEGRHHVNSRPRLSKAQRMSAENRWKLSYRILRRSSSPRRKMLQEGQRYCTLSKVTTQKYFVPRQVRSKVLVLRLAPGRDETRQQMRVLLSRVHVHPSNPWALFSSASRFPLQPKSTVVRGPVIRKAMAIRRVHHRPTFRAPIFDSPWSIKSTQGL